MVYRLEAQKCKYLLIQCANSGASSRPCRFLSSAEVSAALRPFYFSVHPDLFGRYPAERVSHNCEQAQYCIGHCTLSLAGLYLIYVMFLEFRFCVQMVVITTILTIFCLFLVNFPFLCEENTLLRSLYYLFMYVAFNIWSSFWFLQNVV